MLQIKQAAAQSNWKFAGQGRALKNIYRKIFHNDASLHTKPPLADAGF